MVQPRAQTLSDDLAGRGIWVNTPSRFDEADVSLLSQFGVRRVQFMVSHDIKTYASCSKVEIPEQTVSKKSLTSAIRIAQSAGLKVFVTSYVPPSKEIIDRMLDDDSILRAATQSGITGVEYDLEGQWVRAPVCGFTDHVAAADYLISSTRTLRLGISVGVTVHNGRLSSEKIPIEKFDWISAQAYSKCASPPCVERRSDLSRPQKGNELALKEYAAAYASAWDNPDNQPGLMQREMARKLTKRGKIVVVGLPAYSQIWNAGHTVNEAMQLAHDAVITMRENDSRYVGVNYWALTNIKSPKSHPDIKKFLINSKHTGVGDNLLPD
jgi:hypothetical protein